MTPQDGFAPVLIRSGILEQLSPNLLLEVFRAADYASQAAQVDGPVLILNGQDAKKVRASLETSLIQAIDQIPAELAAEGVVDPLALRLKVRDWVQNLVAVQPKTAAADPLQPTLTDSREQAGFGGIFLSSAFLKQYRELIPLVFLLAGKTYGNLANSEADREELVRLILGALLLEDLPMDPHRHPAGVTFEPQIGNLLSIVTRLRNARKFFTYA
ncbi:MAG: hypothetical protein A2Z83_01705 [Omnitrophica bacterium GWA2_52_8]|nr:MAG: hypothetical protein A2Z83_01705 [Omnitrophica bacterium GWA2_52_8]